MARTARKKSDTGMYSVILKGKTDIFRNDDDYEDFIERMNNSDADILGFGLIRDHVFICIKESGAGISADIRSIIISYARYYNKKYGLSGKLFDGRFKSEPLNSVKEAENCVRLVQDVVNITGEDGYTSVGGDGAYEMIPFFEYDMGIKKNQSRRNNVSDSSSHKETQKKDNTVKKNTEKTSGSNSVNHDLPKTDKNTDIPAANTIKKPKKDLPPWLL